MANDRLVASDPKPTRRLRKELAEARDDGLPFEEAWTYALQMAKADRWWTAAFVWSRDEWEACYQRRAPGPTARVLRNVAAPDDLTAA